jgi:hypothetical protein
MKEIQGRETPIRRRETEMSRPSAIVAEMESAVRFLGGDSGNAKQENREAARLARLPVTVIERLRWKKIKRPFADIVDTIREAVERHNEESLRRAQHELTVAKAQNAALVAYLEASDPDFYGPEITRLRGQAAVLGRPDDHEGAA